MLKDGKYSVWMRTPLAEGMGIVMLAPDGKLSGRDTIMSYTGHWRVEGEQFEANVSAVRHSTGPGAFGALADKIDVTVIGLTRGGVTASCNGTAKQAPGLKLEATLVRMADGQIFAAALAPLLRFDGGMPRDPYIREKYTREVKTARALARDYFERFPKDRYETSVDSWRHLQCDNYEFTMKRLREPKPS